LLLLALPGAALAWEAASDASGAIEIRDAGKIVAGFSPKTPMERRGQPIVRHVLVAGHRVLEVRMPILGEGPKREEVWVAELPAKNVIWWDEAGARDVDGETAQEIVVTEKGIAQFQTAARLNRCDGAPAQLFRRAWDFANHRFGPSPLPCRERHPTPSKPTGVMRRRESPWVVFTFTRLPVPPGWMAMRAAFQRPPQSMTTILPRCGPQTTEQAGVSSSPRVPARDLPSPASRYCPATPGARRLLPPRPGRTV
jgi:hypothetical protein